MHGLQVIKSKLPKSVGEARVALTRLERDIDSADYQRLREIEGAARYYRHLHSGVDEVRQQAERIVTLVERRVGEELRRQPKAKGTRGQLAGRDASGGALKAAPETPAATYRELVGSPKTARRLSTLGSYAEPVVRAAITELHAKGDNANSTSVVKHIKGEETQKRREESRAALSIPNGLDWRIGDCREVMEDGIEDGRAAAIITDLPWLRKAEPLYLWVSEWAERKLVLGGSMFAFVPKGWLDRVMAIFSAHLTYRWQLMMRLTQTYPMPGVNVQNCSTVVLWYSKGPLRPGLMLADELPSPAPDKSLHEWGQGSAAVVPIIEARTKPGELILDPCAGSGAFAFQAHKMGRRVICCDLERGGTTMVKVDRLAEAAD
jgi:hypothetical protein